MKLVQDNLAGTSMFYFVKMKQVQDNRAGTSMFYPVLPDSMHDLPAPLVPRFTTAKKYNRNYRARRAARRCLQRHGCQGRLSLVYEDVVEFRKQDKSSTFQSTASFKARYAGKDAFSIQ
uniref:Uncharacterized protein n=1 Tax=Aegilops tauschii TaxID=37682 RepID=M8BG10_AEGTA